MYKIVLCLFLSLFLLLSCSSEKGISEVVIYTSVDQVFSSKIFKEFEKQNGIRIKAVYDTEASKAVGLEKRLLQEKLHPRADLFWNSEYVRTKRLEREGLFLKQGKRSVFAMGLRTRVFIVNTNKLDQNDYPLTLQDLLNPKYKGKIAISNPLFGTASTHFAALLAKYKEKKFIHFLQQLKKNDVAILAGNATVKNAVGHGEYLFGLVDTDDALVGIAQKLPLKMLFYDQQQEGVFGIYGTLALMKKKGYSKEAQKLFDFLFSPLTEEKLIAMNAVQFALLSKDSTTKDVKIWVIPADETLKYLKRSAELIREYLE